MNAIDSGATFQRQAQDQIEREFDNADRHELAYIALNNELRTALKRDPRRKVWTPGWGKNDYTAACDVVLDSFSGHSGEDNLVALLTILGQAAQGYAVAEAARTLLGKLCAKHAEFHASDAVEA